MLASLRKAIRKDRTYFVKAKIDPMFENNRALIDELLKDIFKEAETNAQNEFSKLNSKFDFEKIDCLVHNKHISKDAAVKFDEVRQNIQIINNGINSKSYFGYLDAVDKIYETKITLEDIQKILINDKESLRHNLDIYDSKKQKYMIELKNISDEIKDLSVKQKSNLFIKILIIYGSGLAFLALLLLNKVNSPFLFFSYLIFFVALIKYTLNTSISGAIIGFIPFCIIVWIYVNLFDFIRGIFDYIIMIYIIALPFIPDKTIKSELNEIKEREKNIEKQIETTSFQLDEINKIWLDLHIF